MWSSIGELGGSADSEKPPDTGTARTLATLDQRGGGALPHLADMERSFGRSFAGVRAHTGMAAMLAPLGAQALTVGNTVAFADERPSPALVAHEVTHVVQNERVGATHAMASGVVAARDCAAESEADAMAERVATHGAGVELPSVLAAPAAHVHLAPAGHHAYAPPDRSADVRELRAALAKKDGDGALRVLQRNTDREAMYALRVGYGPSFGSDLRSRLSATQFARARGLAGDQIALDAQLEGEDAERTLATLERMSDAEAYALMLDKDQPNAIALPDPGPVAAHAKLADLQAAMRRQLKPDDYYRAMRMVLDKAQRVAAHVDPKDLGARFVRGAVSTERVDLAEERVRAAEGKAGSKAEVDAYLAIADLDASQRHALAKRLHAKPLRDRPLHDSPLHEDALAQTDDATVVRQALEHARRRGAATGHTPDGVGLEVALQKAGDLIRAARMKARDPNAKKADRDAAQKEVDRLQDMFYATPAANPILATAGGGDIATKRQRLESVGLDPVALGAELLAGVWVTTDIPGLIAVLKQIPATARRDAMVRANKMIDLQRMPEDKRKLVEAYLDVGAPTVVPGPNDIVIDAKNVPGAQAIVPPEVVIATHEIVEGIQRGPAAAHLVLSRLQRLSPAERALVFKQPEYMTARFLQPRGDAKSEARDFADALRRAETNDGIEIAIANYPGPAGPWQQVSLEHVRVIAEKAGHAKLRRGYVLAEQIKGNPAARDRLSPADRSALDAFDEVAKLRPQYADPKQSEVADDIAFGSIQLTSSAEGVVDPNTEADFMNQRLHGAVGIAQRVPLGSWAGSPEAIQALTEFDTMYANGRTGGISKAELPQLAEIYYRALREVEKYKLKLAENNALASMAATVAGVVVSIGLSIVTAGTALPLIAAAALGGTAGGLASAAVGASIRIHNTTGSVLRDAGAGFVEGVTSVASAGLAAKVVRSATAGVDAGKAIASVGGKAVAQATHDTAAAALATTMLDGAFSGAAGELFQTAVDEATWNRGVGEALAKMLAAIARGGALGAAAGGALGGLAKLAKRLGPDAAEGVGQMFDRASIARDVVDGLGEHAQDELVRINKLIEGGMHDEAEAAIAKVSGLSKPHRDKMLAYARGRALHKAGAKQGIELEGEILGLEFVDEAAFKKLAGDQRAHAAVVIKDGKLKVVAHKGTPISSLQEELIHLKQWETSAVMRSRMENLSEEKLAHWKDLPPAKKVEMHIDRLELEADAQRRLIAHYSALDDDAEAVTRTLDAEEALFSTTEQLKRLRAAKPPLDLHALELEHPPRIFSSTAQSTRPSGPGARNATKLLGKNVHDPAVQQQLKDIGYTPHQIEGQKDVFRLVRAPDRMNLPHLSVAQDGTIIKGTPRQSFAEVKADAKLEWKRTQADLMEQATKRYSMDLKVAEAAKAALAESGWKTVRPELERLLRAGTIDEGTAGLVSKWGHVLEELEARFGVDIKALLAKHLTSKSITSGELSALRGEIRELTAKNIVKLRGAKRGEVLGEMLKVQPDEASKGHLFREYRREVMRGDETFGVSDGSSPESFSGKDLKNRRTPDDVLFIHDEVEGQLAPGRYAIEDKAGPGAFKLDQARDYARRAYKPGQSGGGFVQTKNGKKPVYDGLVYVFSNKAEANAARKLMRSDDLIANALNKEPGGIHVMYANKSGNIERLTGE